MKAKRRFIIVDGNDCTGKSTLVSELRSALRPHGGWDTKHLVYRTGDQFLRFLSEYVNGENLIFNRSHYSEIIYGKHLRGTELFSQAHLNALETFIKQYGLVIHCALPPDEILIRMEARNRIEILDEDEICEELIRAISEEYDRILNDPDVIKYCCRTPDDLRKVIEVVKERIFCGGCCSS